MLTNPENEPPSGRGAARGPENYNSAHWEEPNILAHVRFDDRTGPNGEKILHVAEVQSDWHQQGRKRGYAPRRPDAEISADIKAVHAELKRREPNLDETSGSSWAKAWGKHPDLATRDYELQQERAGHRGGVPDAPFKTTWPELAMKRVLRYAAEHGYDRVTWDTGTTQAQRYGLSNHVEKFRVAKTKHDRYDITVTGRNGRAAGAGTPTAEQLHHFIGEELAARVIADLRDVVPGKFKTYSGLDLEVGGEGQKGFYDDILPKTVGKLVKKWGAKVEDAEIPVGRADWSQGTVRQNQAKERAGIGGTEKVHAVTITPDMRESVMRGQPMFQRGEGEERQSPRMQEVEPGLLGRLPERPSESEARLIEQVNRIARQIVPTAKIVPARQLMLKTGTDASGQAQGRNIWGATYVDGPRQLIAWSIGSPDRVGTIRHEAIHYLRNLGFFTPKEWETLREAALKGDWLGKHQIHQRYPKADDAERIEEAVAEEFANWNRKATTPEPLVRRLFARLKDMLGRVQKYLRSLFGAHATADDIFEEVLSGEVGMRPMTGEKTPDAQVFAQAAKTPEGPPETPQDGRDYIDKTAEDLAEHMRSGGPGTYSRELQRLSPPTGPEIFARPWFQQHIMGPRTVAEIDTKSGTLWNAVKVQDDEGNRRLADMRDRIEKTFLKLPRESQDRVNAVMELDRLNNLTRQNDGRQIVARNETFNDARGSRPGERLILNPKESAAYFELQNMYRHAWDNIMEGTARRLGWIRRWSPAMGDNLKTIGDAMESANHPRDRKAFGRLHSVLAAMEEQRRAAYMPLMRFGDYYVSVKEKEAPGVDSTGGFPKTAWFEMVERPAFQYADANPITLVKVDTTTTGQVPEYAKARIDDLTKKFPPAAYRIEHGYLMSKPDALRSLGIPAVEKLMMLMEGGVMARMRDEMSMDGFADKKLAREAATKKYEDLYGELVDAIQDEMYEQLKAGFKKRSNAVPGYSGDWNRVLGSYMGWTSRHVARQIHGDAIERAFDDIQLHHPHPAIKQFWRKWRQDDEDPVSPLSRAGNAANQAGFLWTLAMNPASTISVMMHGPVYAMPVMSLGVGMHKAGPAFVRAYGDATAGMRSDAKQGLHINIGAVGKTPDERAFLKQMERDGDLHAKGTDDIRSMGAQAAALWGGYGPHAKQIMDVLSSNIALVDQANRVAASLGAYRLARDGNLRRMNQVWSANQVWRAIAQRDGVSPETMGKFLMTQAVGEWGSKARTEFGRTPMGRMFSALHGFQIRFVSNLIKLMLRSGTPGRVALAWTLAGLWTAAGLQGLPFFQDAENLVDALWKAISKRGHDPMTAWRVRALLADTGLGKMGAEFMLRGPMSVLSGADFSSRLGFGDVITRDVLPIFGAGEESGMTFPSIVAGSIGGAQRLAKSHQKEMAATEALPGALRHPAQAQIETEKGVKSQSGRNLVPKRKFTASDAIETAMGLTPLDVTRAREKSEFRFRARTAHGPLPKDMTP